MYVSHVYVSRLYLHVTIVFMPIDFKLLHKYKMYVLQMYTKIKYNTFMKFEYFSENISLCWQNLSILVKLSPFIDEIWVF